MNAERLHVIARAIQSEMQGLGIVANLKQIAGSLQKVVSQPQQPEHQKALNDKLGELNKQLEKAPSNRFSPAWRQILKETGVETLLGSSLADRLRAVFVRHQITPAIALEEIQAIHREVDELRSAIDQVTNSFAALHISAQDLEPGQCEIGFLVPRAAVDNRLDAFGKELGELNFMLPTFSELVTTKRDSFDIRSVSSTDLAVYLAVIPQVAACMAVAVERVIYTYKNLLEIRKLKASLQEKSVPDNRLDGIEEHAATVMKDGIEEIINEIFENYCTVKGERKNELKNALRFTLNKLANRIDRGYNIEIRVKPLAPSGEEKEPEENEVTRQHIETILEKAGALEFMSLEGKPILSLPESEKKRK